MNEPSFGAARAWMERAWRTLALGRQALNGEFYEQVPNRAYYGAFYAATALLVTRELEPSRHSAVLQLFGREFVKTGEMAPEHGRRLNLLFEERQQADYLPSPGVTAEDAEQALDDAEAFVAAASAFLDRSEADGRTGGACG